MQRGRKPKPVELHLVDGSDRHLGKVARQRMARAARPTSPVGAVPAAFNVDQRAVWERLVQDAPDGLLTGVDRDVLVNYVVLVAARDKALGLFNETGCQVLVRAADGHGTVTNPLMRELRRNTEAMRMLQGELGFTPSARARVTVVPKGEADELQRFLEGPPRKG